MTNKLIYSLNKMTNKNLNHKVNKTQLMYLLGVSYKTALKEYKIIIDSLQLKRDYLTVKDLIDYKLIP